VPGSSSEGRYVGPGAVSVNSPWRAYDYHAVNLIIQSWTNPICNDVTALDPVVAVICPLASVASRGPFDSAIPNLGLALAGVALAGCALLVSGVGTSWVARKRAYE
jgi:hypothetical protein